MVITLLRSFSKVHNINEQPRGQELFPHEYRFTLAPIDASVTANALQRVQDRLQARPLCFLSEQTYRDSLLDIEGDICVSALLPGAEPDTFLLRLYNPSEGSVLAKLRMSLPLASAEICDLLEEPQKALTVSDNTVEIALRGYDIVCLSLRLADGARKNSDLSQRAWV